jgi:hypothetical protein
MYALLNMQIKMGKKIFLDTLLILTMKTFTVKIRKRKT